MRRIFCFVGTYGRNIFVYLNYHLQEETNESVKIKWKNRGNFADAHLFIHLLRRFAKLKTPLE